MFAVAKALIHLAFAAKEHAHKIPLVGQNAFDTTQLPIRVWSGHLQNFNRGAMMQITADPTDTTTDCYTKTTEVNTLIEYMFDETNYSTGELNQAEFLDNFQICSFSYMEQVESCGLNELLITLDTTSTQLNNFVANITNLGTQTALGWTDRDSPIFLAIDDFRNSNGDFTKRGEGFMLLLSQAVKFEAPAAVVEVSPTSA